MEVHGGSHGIPSTVGSLVCLELVKKYLLRCATVCSPESRSRSCGLRPLFPRTSWMACLYSAFMDAAFSST